MSRLACCSMLMSASIAGSALAQGEVDPQAAGRRARDAGAVLAGVVPLGTNGEHGNCVTPAERRRANAIVRQYFVRTGGGYQPGGENEDGEPPLYRFYPMAVNQWEDGETIHFNDLDPASPGFHDFECDVYAYDGHDATDTLIRSFAEQHIGVPVLAVEDGVVIATHDGEFDEVTEPNNQPSNYVIMDHGDGRVCYYWHLKKDSVAVEVDEFVRAGQVIGETGSSGHSYGPHLHFASNQDAQQYEPYAGTCRAGASGWLNQTPIPKHSYVHDFAFTEVDLYEVPPIPYEVPRTGQFEFSDEYLRTWMFINYVPENSSYVIRLYRPDGSLSTTSGPWEIENPFWASAWLWFLVWDFDMHQIAGEWRMEFILNGEMLVDAPFEVVPVRDPDVNRPPKPIAARMDPATPAFDDVVFCRVGTDLIIDDLDYDIIRYTYDWSINGESHASFTRAGYADALPRAAAQPGDLLECTVTPNDGELDGPSAGAWTWLRGDSLTMHFPYPGLAGQQNALAASGAAANANVGFAYATRLGQTNLPGCGGVVLALRSPKLIGFKRADASGFAQMVVPVPVGARGALIYLASFDLDNCVTSEPREVRFR